MGKKKRTKAKPRWVRHMVIAGYFLIVLGLIMSFVGYVHHLTAADDCPEDVENCADEKVKHVIYAEAQEAFSLTLVIAGVGLIIMSKR